MEQFRGQLLCRIDIFDLLSQLDLFFAMPSSASLKSLLTFATLATSAAAVGFPDCTQAPLKGNDVCDTSKDPVTRAAAIVNLFTVPELINNTINGSPGVPRLGLPAYQWWQEGLVSSATPHY